MTKDPDLKSAYALSSKEEITQLYQSWADSYDAGFGDAQGYQSPREVALVYIGAGGRGPVLDVGAGTGLVAEHFARISLGPVDALDLSPEMLAVAERKGHYRNLYEANLKETLALPDAAYAGLISSGTFTHGHVGPEALPELVRVMAPGGVAVISVRPQVWVETGFEAMFDALASDTLVSEPVIAEELVYADPNRAPEGHGHDTGYIVTFRRL